jgi:nucleoside phosphorylase
MKEFSTFLAKIKRSAWSDQYLILSAMFCLDAQSKPVTAAEISKLIELHLHKGGPKNINTSLRSYTGIVAPIENGPPRKWSLTDAGVERLREISKLELKVGSELRGFDFDVGIICALEFPEFDAVTNVFNEQPWNDIDNTNLTHAYRQSVITTDSGLRLRIVGTTSTSMGLTAAAITATQLILHFKPRIVIMIGIAAGTRAGGKQFGDVLAADPSVDYNSGKVIFENGIREFQPDPYPISLNPKLRSVLHRYNGNHPVFEKIRARWLKPHPSKVTRLHVGPLGAADQVIDDESRVTEIVKNWRKLIGVEMETYGVYRAAYEAPEPKPRFVSFKSVCDFAAEKGDSWQDYAAFTAAQFAFEFLKTEWNAIWPKQ